MAHLPSKFAESSWLAYQLIVPPNQLRLPYTWISLIAPRCSLRPAIYYVTDHYIDYAAVLVRLCRVNPDTLRDLLGMAYKFVTRESETPSVIAKRLTRQTK